MATPTKAEVQLYAPSLPDAVKAVKDANLLLPQVGNWSIDIEGMAGDDAIVQDADGSVVVQWSASTLQGFVVRAQPDRGVWQGLIVGGKGGLNKAVTAQHFYQTSALDIVTKTLQLVGETLASDSTGLATAISYPRRAISASRCLDELCDVLGLIWRVKLDGTVWLGTYTWPTATATFTFSDSTNQDDAKLMPDPQQPLLEPGTTVVLDVSAGATADEKSAQKIAVSHYVITDNNMRAQLWFVDPTASAQIDDQLAPDRMHAGVTALALQAGRSTDWYRLFQGRVVQQRSDGTLDVILDQVRGLGELPSIRGVQIDTVVGGAVRRVRGDERCTVIFEAGDFRKPRVVGFEADFGNAKALGVARQTDTVDRNSDLAGWMSKTETLFTQLVISVNQLAVYINAIAPGTVTPITAPAPTAIGATVATISSSSADLKLPPGTS